MSLDRDTKNKGFKDALAAMQRRCATREYCNSDIVRLCSRFNLSAQESEAIIEALQRDSFLSETRYANAYAREKSSLNGWGRDKITWSLKSKGIPQDTITAAISQIDKSSEEERLFSILENKIRHTNGEPKELKVKLIRFALSRGFPYEVVIPLVNKIVNDFVVKQNDN